MTGFETVEKKVEGSSETNQDSPLNGNETKEHKFKFLTGNKISEEEALENSKKLFNVTNDNDLTIAKSGKGADGPMYSISYRNGDKNAYMDMSQKGGHPISLLVDRHVGDKKISLNEGAEKAKAYIDEFDFENMAISQSSEYDNIGVYSFLYADDDVHVYSDSIEVKVALDNGDIIGLNARNYFMNHTDRDIPEP